MKHYAIERAANPRAFYETSEDVLRDKALTDHEKEHILKSMEVDAAAFHQEAPSDAPVGDRPPGPDAISDALNRLRDGFSRNATGLQGEVAPSRETRHFTRIAVALCGRTELDRKVVGLAVALAAPWKAALSFVILEGIAETPALTAGLPARGVLTTPPVLSTEEIEARLDLRRAEALSLLEAADVEPRPDLDLRQGQPETQILKHAEDRAADLIVVGSQNRSWFERLVTSDPSRPVASAANCPVMIVPEG